MKPAEVVQEVGQRLVLESIRVRVGGIGVRRALELLDTLCHEEVLPRRLCRDDRKFRRLLEPVRGPEPARRGLFRSDELVEGAGEQIAERCRAEHRMDAREVVVHPRAVNADDLAQRGFHRAQPSLGNAERAAEVPEVVVVADPRNRIEQRRDRLRKVLVDVRVRPANPRTRWTARTFEPRSCNRTGLDDPELAVTVDRPFDVLRGAEGLFNVERQPRELRDLNVVEQERFRGRRFVRPRPAHPPVEAGFSRPVSPAVEAGFSRPVDRHPPRVHRSGHERFSHSAAVLDQHLPCVVWRHA